MQVQIMLFVRVSKQSCSAIHNFVINMAFFNELRHIHMKQPWDGQENMMCNQEGDLWVKTSAHCWNDELNSHLKGMDFVQAMAAL